MGLVSASMVMGMPMIVGAHTEDEVQLALDWASESVESYCERKFAYVASETVFVDPYKSHSIRASARLRNPPVTNVGTVLAQVQGSEGLTWVELQYYEWAADGLLYDTSAYYGYFDPSGSAFWSGFSNGDGYFDN